MARPRIYLLNENYFEKIDSPNKAYILGFIYADGSVNIRNASLTICLSEKDKNVLEFIKKELEYSGIIRTKVINDNNYSLLNINSKKLIHDLIDLGIVQNKTYESKTLPNTPVEYYNDMLRGFFDGDGSIYGNVKNQYTVVFSSNIFILNIIKNYLASNNIKTGQIRLRNKNSIYSGMLEMRGNNQILKFKQLIYKDRNLYSLKRKAQKFEEFIDYISNMTYRKRSENEIRLIKKLYLEGLKQKEIHLKLKIPFSSVRGVIQRLRKKNEIK